MATRTVDLGKVVGPPGPNSVSITTATNLTGVLAGNGSTVEVKPVDATPTANSGNLVTSGGVAAKASSIAAGMAIIATGNTHAAITTGQYVYIQDHDTLPEGMYEATANIAANGTLSASNVTAKTEGVANALKETISQEVIYGTSVSKNDISLASTGTFTWDLPAGSWTTPTGYTRAGFLIYTNTYRFYVAGWGGDRIYYTVVNASTTVNGEIIAIPIFIKL